MGGYRFCVHVMTAGFLAAAGSAALSGLAATATAEPAGGGGSHESGSHESSRSHAGSSSGDSARHSAGSGSSESAGASQSRQTKTIGTSSTSTNSESSAAGGGSTVHGGAAGSGTAVSNSGGAQATAGGQTAGHSAAVKPKTAATPSGDASSSADGRNSPSGAKAVTKTRALTEPKPSTSGVSGTPAAVDKPAAVTVAGGAEAARPASQQQPAGGKSVSETSTGPGAALPDHTTMSAAVNGVKGEVKADQTQLVDPQSLQPNVIHKSESPSSVSSALTGDTDQARRVGPQTPGRESSRSASHAAVDRGAKTADTAGLLSSSVGPGADNAVTSTVRIAQGSPSTAAITDVKVPEHLATVQIPNRPSPIAGADTLAVPATVAAAAVTAPTAPAPVAPVAPPLPVPVVPANAPTAPGGTTASITSALADVRKRSEASGDTVTQEPANPAQAPHVQNAASTTQAVDAGDDSVLTSAEALTGVASAAAQAPENVPHVRVARDISSVAAAADDFAGRSTELSGKAKQLAADAAKQTAAKAKVVADEASLRQRYEALTAERVQLNAAIDQHNENLATVNADDAAIARDNAALSADILKHNAASPLFKIWPLNVGYNAEGAALAARQAALNTRIIANTQAKLKFDAEGAELNAQGASIHARTDEQLAEGIALEQRKTELQQSGQELEQRVSAQDAAAQQFADDIGQALDQYTPQIIEHAYDRHRAEFPNVNSREDLEAIIRDTVENADIVRGIYNERMMYRALYFKKDPTGDGGTVVFIDPNTSQGATEPRGGTVFRPDNGLQYVQDQIKKSDTALGKNPPESTGQESTEL